jgi:hypothetical protein
MSRQARIALELSAPSQFIYLFGNANTLGRKSKPKFYISLVGVRIILLREPENSKSSLFRFSDPPIPEPIALALSFHLKTKAQQMAAMYFENVAPITISSICPH